MPTTLWRPAPSRSADRVRLVRYRMPAEWQPHEATWLTWPTNRTTWPGRMLADVERTYLEMMCALLEGEKVHLLVPDAAAGARVTKRLRARRAATGRLVLHAVRTVDTWIRDYGPIFVKAPGRPKAFTKWIFNAWGGKYKDLARDNGVVDRIDALRSVPRADVPVVLEGGSIDTNGAGVCLTTEQCLLNPNRNPSLGRRSIERLLSKHLGFDRVIWLREGIEGDDTDGHVDDITRFVGPRTIVTAVEPDRTDANHHVLAENLEILRSVSGPDGRPFEIVELPMPGRVGSGRGGSSYRLPASYANFYIGNRAVLVPVYGHRNDAQALRVLKKLFPGRRVVGIECTSLVYGLGSIHCVTQQEPA